MKTAYNKLIRDKIPEIIKSNGNECTVEILDDRQYLNKLDEKLNEELAEYQKDKSIEELADLLEVIYAVTAARGYTIEKLESVRLKKRAERGGFENKILLKDIF